MGDELLLLVCALAALCLPLALAGLIVYLGAWRRRRRLQRHGPMR